jgi:catechol 2,3-dioxygenase-like lactoylglutathione lyase family enzyme
MHLNHIDLQVSDVSAARKFFEDHFGLRCTFQRKEQLALMLDDAGMQFGVSNLFGSAPPVYPPDFHIGFILQSEADVRAVRLRLEKAGIEMRTDVSRGGPNIYFMCVGPDGIGIEVRAPADQPESAMGAQPSGA